jgi:hypothetical protein
MTCAVPQLPGSGRYRIGSFVNAGYWLNRWFEFVRKRQTPLMAIILGFLVLLAVAVPAAYLVGVRSARPGQVLVLTAGGTTRPPPEVSREVTENKAPTTASTTTIVGRETPEPSLPKPVLKKTNSLHGRPFADSRSCERLGFAGTALATIYPRPGRGKDDALHCVIGTRDISRSGIGIAHTDQLFPHQIIVIELVGKLLVGEVRWCRREAKDLYVAGVRLVKATS